LSTKFQRQRGTVTTHGNLAVSLEGAGEKIEVAQDRGNGITTEGEQLLSGGLVAADKGGVVLERGLADGDKVLEEALAGVGEGRVGQGVKGPSEAELVARHNEELSNADKTLAQAAFDHLGALDIFGRRLTLLLVVDIFGNDGWQGQLAREEDDRQDGGRTSVDDAHEEYHGGHGLAELVARDEGP
jgi:hypothetical protein